MRALFAKGVAQSGVLRKLDARTKLIVTATTAVLTVASSGMVSQLVLFAVTLVYVLLLKRPGLVAVLYVLMAAMMAIAALCALGFQLWMPGLGGLSAKMLLIPFLRGLSMMNVVMVLALTTRVEDLLLTLERMKLPFVIFLPTAVMLRFIPTFANDIKQVWETLRIKGWPLGPAMLTLHPILSARLILAPILFRALKSSETLGVAAELKGMGARQRTIRSDGVGLCPIDWNVLGLLVLTTVAVICCEIWLAHIWMPDGGVKMMH